MPERRIVSLLASATEILDALGAIDRLVGRSHECDNPPSILSLPVCTRPLIDVDADSRGIDEQVRNSARNALSIYEVFDDVLERLQPTHILTQVQCDVCAVSLRDVERSIASRLESAPQIVSLNPVSLDGIWDDFRLVASAAGVPSGPVIERLQSRMCPVRRTQRVSIACIDWIEPLMAAGNWMPELISLAGAENVFGVAGIYSPWISFDDLIAKDPDIILVAPCGFELARTAAEMHWLADRPEFARLSAVRNNRVFLADGNRYFNRSGPCVVDTFEILCEIVDSACGEAAETPYSEHCGTPRWSLYSNQLAGSRVA